MLGEVKNGSEDAQFTKSVYIKYFFYVLCIILLSITAASSVYLSLGARNKNECVCKHSEITLTKSMKDVDGSELLTPGNVRTDLKILTREQWLAQPPSSNLTDLELPSLRVIIAHTATERCVSQAECVFRVRFIQTFHMESRGWDDIGYNFLVGGDGAIYIGRGWDKQGTHTKSYNRKSICIAFVGTFDNIKPPERQLLAAQRLIQEGVKIKKLDPNYRLLGHRQLMRTESPGATLYEIMKTWPNWTNNTEI